MGIRVNSITCSSITVVENFLKQFLPLLLLHSLVGHSPPPLGTVLALCGRKDPLNPHTPGTDAP